MKNFVKVIALATVACMLLSVSAFAAVTPAPETDEITLDVVAGAGEEVAVLVVAAGTDVKGETVSTDDDLTDSKIEYIGQVTADATTGLANFGTFTVKSTDAKVDIWVGSTTLSAANGAQKIGENIDLAAAKKITLVTDGYYLDQVVGEGGAKSAIAAGLTVNLDGLNVSKMIWAFKVGENWKYSQAITAPGDNVVDGAVTYAVALNAYDENKDEITVDKVAAIFLTGEANADNTHFVAEDANDVADLKAGNTTLYPAN